MSKNVAILVLVVFVTTTTYSQTSIIKGSVRNYQTTAYVPGATVKLQSINDTSFIQASISDSAGKFQFSQLPLDSFKLSITSVGFTPSVVRVKSDTAIVNLGAIDLKTASTVLAGVTVTASSAMAVQKADTVQYNANQFKVNPDASAEDLVKKMPGITSQNGTVTAHGETVQKVTIDGRELFGDDATAALRNLPAEIVDKIQVFDRLSDQAQFTGFDDGSSQKGINIITKANMRNGQFGRVYAGYGTDGRYQAGGNSTILHGDQKISLVGNFNNVNTQNFAAQDLLGVTSTGGGRGGGGGGPRGGGGGGGPRGGGGQGGGGFNNNANFLVGQQNGINKTNAFGLNYADNLGQKLIVAGSYFFNNTNNNTNELNNRQYLTKGIQNTNQNTISNSTNNNNRVNLRIEYRIDSSNQLIITPALSFQNNHSNRDVVTSFIDQNSSAASRRTNNSTNSQTSGNNLNNNILYRHSFKKRGRTFSVNLFTSSNSRNGDVYTNYLDTIFTTSGIEDSSSRRNTKQLSSGYQIAGNIVYTEPLGKLSQLQLNYNPTYSRSKADQEAYVYEENTGKYSSFDPRLSNKFDNTYTTQNAGLSYRYGNRDNQLSFGANYQISELNSDQSFPRTLKVNKSFNNVLPSLMARLKLSTKSSLRIFYRSNVNQPSVTQLQDVYDITNSPFVTAGNPQLNQQFSNIIST
ncbi:MAG TPA: TonB-dependent receptor, partial [Segetibacter sp.]|nr:TonB-dependent receptor [Segetibacter sp.]